MTLDAMIIAACEEYEITPDGDVFGQVFDDEIEYTYDDVKRIVYGAAQTYDLFA